MGWKNTSGFVPISGDSDCNQTSRQQAPCSATCQCHGSQKAVLDVCSNKTVVPAALVSAHSWALKTRLLRGHNTANPTWNMMGVTAGTKALMSTVSVMSFHFPRKTLNLTPISRSEQCPQPNLRTLKVMRVRIVAVEWTNYLIIAKKGWKMKLGLQLMESRISPQHVHTHFNGKEALPGGDSSYWFMMG